MVPDAFKDISPQTADRVALGIGLALGVFHLLRGDAFGVALAAVYMATYALLARARDRLEPRPEEL